MYILYIVKYEYVYVYYSMYIAANHNLVSFSLFRNTRIKYIKNSLRTK